MGNRNVQAATDALLRYQGDEADCVHHLATQWNTHGDSPDDLHGCRHRMHVANQMWRSHRRWHPACADIVRDALEDCGAPRVERDWWKQLPGDVQMRILEFLGMHQAVALRGATGWTPPPCVQLLWRRQGEYAHDVRQWQVRWRKHIHTSGHLRLTGLVWHITVPPPDVLLPAGHSVDDLAWFRGIRSVTIRLSRDASRKPNDVAALWDALGRVRSEHWTLDVERDQRNWCSPALVDCLARASGTVTLRGRGDDADFLTLLRTLRQRCDNGAVAWDTLVLDGRLTDGLWEALATVGPTGIPYAPHLRVRCNGMRRGQWLGELVAGLLGDIRVLTLTGIDSPAMVPVLGNPVAWDPRGRTLSVALSADLLRDPPALRTTLRCVLDCSPRWFGRLTLCLTLSLDHDWEAWQQWNLVDHVCSQLRDRQANHTLHLDVDVHATVAPNENAYRRLLAILGAHAVAVARHRPVVLRVPARWVETVTAMTLPHRTVCVDALP